MPDTPWPQPGCGLPAALQPDHRAGRPGAALPQHGGTVHWWVGLGGGGGQASIALALLAGYRLTPLISPAVHGRSPPSPPPSCPPARANVRAAGSPQRRSGAQEHADGTDPPHSERHDEGVLGSGLIWWCCWAYEQHARVPGADAIVRALLIRPAWPVVVLSP